MDFSSKVWVITCQVPVKLSKKMRAAPLSFYNTVRLLAILFYADNVIVGQMTSQLATTAASAASAAAAAAVICL